MDRAELWEGENSASLEWKLVYPQINSQIYLEAVLNSEQQQKGYLYREDFLLKRCSIDMHHPSTKLCFLLLFFFFNSSFFQQVEGIQTSCVLKPKSLTPLGLSLLLILVEGKK